MRLQKLNVVAIGGGHGLGRVLSTLSFLSDQLTGIVATTDNGGSTGKLRKRTSSIAWGDLRNCLTQLVEPDSVGNQLFNFRFDGNDELGGHNLGNLILFGLNEIQSRPLDSINLISNILRVKTKVYPMSETPTDLLAFYEHGRCKVGEISVDDMPAMPSKLMLAPLVKSIPECLIAIENADLIILGPGSFLTSVLPPLLVNDIRSAIEKRTGQCVLIDNINQEDSPAGRLLLDDKLNWLQKNLGCLPIDTVITQDKTATSEKVNVLCRNLSDSDNKDYHDKQRLLAVLEECASGLTFEDSDVVNG
ncbi:gluconeogenesis factor YvcK family protein [Thalassotalea mangrovi]|uniref:Putative gluconeogenesis factor n=1 Tax=Thalassotalea mangrovi TaxID=2572245 RepID=A0A4V5NUC0_9GAMM|nr:uridine diphosphate-N-acetylglucosamine-binding protein YvcK [Thalassotalea mangrovi]TKB45749.1 uridine diphosphate-N-acetylglucosamine-binding protein YvcK [Thalassotalea mangrovi]